MLMCYSLCFLWILLLKTGGCNSSTTNNGGGADIMLDIAKMSPLGDPEEILAALRQVAKAVHRCGIKEYPNLKRVFLTNKTVTCNDGTSAGYYIRKAFGSSKWIIFLEGGWFCFDQTSCRERWLNMKSYMTSRMWPEVKKGKGILSWDPEENPYYFYSNMVYIPYCSSDSWTGSIKNPKDSFSFMGSLIIEEVIKDLIPQGLVIASKLILAGSSAGGTGVLMNLDRVSDLMARLAPSVKVRGLADSGWFLDNEQYEPVPCVKAHSCAPTEGIRRGIDLWQGQVPEDCRRQYRDEPWRCYFGYRMYPTLRTPVYIVQYLFDEAQITANNVGPPVKKEQWRFIHEVGNEMKKTLQNVSAVFAPACLSHILLTKSEWQKTAVNGVTLAQSIYCWERGSDEELQCPLVRQRLKKISKAVRKSSGNVAGKVEMPLGDDPVGTKAAKRLKNKKRRRRKKNKRRRRRKNKGKRGKRSLGKNSKRLCKHHLIDSCAWPQCNFSCPKLRNPFTDEEMDFIDLLMQFGLDVSSIANALGMDMETLQSMDHDVLMQMLTQQT
ncbi:palmitoleoyl-protein carboxylesterase notum1'-like [Liolophura sinensis]|uniref:palmitoleoyl-protein carboxylesterase notum1'-like n=1 Tax=Liolophura sinensis TaxID=3198878 RepID=UPI0031599094